jgi:two-component system alkaline phosphatase synthesis response regulator PhoP
LHNPRFGVESGKDATSIGKILIVEDEQRIVQLARDYLERAGYDVASSSRRHDGALLSPPARPDLIVLDLGLPGRDGLDVLRLLRRESNTPVIILTARGEESDKLVGLELGADDYMVKPFSPKELVARVRAVLRRAEGAAEPAEVIRIGDLTLDVPRLRLTVGERTVDVTPTEFHLLAVLARQPGRIFTRSQLLDAVHGVAFESYERAIDTHIKNLRRKIEPDPRRPRYILTVYGVGYRLAES